MRVALVAPLVGCGVMLSGCVSSPTYGTDKTAGEQLLGDVSGILSVAPKNKAPIDYKPRPELVKPAKGVAQTLPEPQDNIVVADGANWPESPEQKRARLRAEATANRDNPGFESGIVSDVALSTKPSGINANDRSLESGIEPIGKRQKQREAFKQKLAENRQGSDTKRRLLSDPPLVYRQPAETAPVGDIGEDEVKKERRLKAAARKKGGGASWRDFIPGF